MTACAHRFGLAICLAAALCAGCETDEAPQEAPSGATLTIAEQVSQAEASLCDAGDEAFIKRLIPLMWGRKPASIREVAILAQVVNQTSRSALVRAMARSSEYRRRWEHFIKDALWVNRAGFRANKACYDDNLRAEETTTLAEYVRDHKPLEDGRAPPGPWTMSDLIGSALLLDDISPIWRAHLFAQAGTAREADISDPYEELYLRDTFTKIFHRTYINRNLGCMNCHNSEYSVVDSPVPELDRAWEIPGFYEEGLYGSNFGRPLEDITPFFRTGGLLTLLEIPSEPGTPQRYELIEGEAPWGIRFDCGRFYPADEIPVDPHNNVGFFIDEVGPRASIWDMEALLADGLDQVRTEGFTPPDPSGSLKVDGRVAFVWMTAVNFADQVWAEHFGRRLTMSNRFPRNKYQRDILWSLVQTFVDSRFSLVEMLVELAAHPYFNQHPPALCESTLSGYDMAPVFDPLSIDSEETSIHLNNVGDTIQRLAPRIMTHATEYALKWESGPRYFTVPEGVDDIGYTLPLKGIFQRDIGMFIKDTESGFRGVDFQTLLTWEHTYGGCEDPNAGDDGDKSDWVDAILQAADPQHSFRDAVIALKDRLLTEPQPLAPQEDAALEALVGAPLDMSLSEMSDAETRLRWVCGALLNTPQFLLNNSGPDRLGSDTAIVVAESSAADLCQGLSAVLFDAAVMSCADGKVSIQLP
jgi:hypothetical protein